MSITAALTSAASGLTATGRAAQSVSQNIANALTPGYGVRDVNLSSHEYGGVRVNGIDRRVDTALLTDRRSADAQAAGAETRLGALVAVADAVGRADAKDSISARLGALQAGLLAAASRPDSEIRLGAAVDAAAGLVATINAAGTAIQDQRLEADREIARAVETLSTGLTRIDDLNDRIAKARATGGDVNALMDLRQQAIDGISDIVPLRQIDRAGGRVALLTETGRVLLDFEPATIGFTPTNGMSAGATLGTPLSGLTLDGRAIDMTDRKGAMAGGRLEALFDLRDSRLPAAQTRLDALALEIAHRFEAPGLDATTGPGAAGLFTDRGAAIGAAPLPGLAQRLTLSDRVDPNAGGAPWRLRDGLGAAAPGDVGEARFLNGLADVLGASATPVSPALSISSRSLLQLGDLIVGQETAEAYRVETDLTFAESRASTLRQMELSQGVDTDAEMQKLLLIEQSYAANARVIQVAGSMIDRLLEI